MKKILIVDDDRGIVTSLSALLKEAGYHTCGVTSGKSALEKVKSESFSLVLLDMVMPMMSGIDLLTELKKLCPNTPAIMITAFPEVEGAIEAVRRGACDYISKPFKSAELFSKVGRAIERAGFREHLDKLDLDDMLHALANPIRRNILRIISSRACVRLTDIARGLSVDDHSKVVFHLKLLVEEGIVEQDREKAYALTREGEKIFECLNIIEKYLSE